MTTDQTEELLERWHAGDRSALGLLVSLHWEWIRGRVRMRLGQKLRRLAESDDFIQETMLDFLEYAPRFTLHSEAQFRGLMVRIVENAIRDQHDFWFQARRRTLSRECPISSDTVIDLAPGGKAVTPPDETSAKREMDARMRLAVELLEPDDRRVVVLRHWDDLDFPAIGEQLTMTADGARKRYRRALPKLAGILERL